MLAATLQLLGKRTTALAEPLLAIGTVFYLVQTVLPDPTPLKLAALAAYAVFMLVVLWIRRQA